ncbi:MAG: hypothetical protein ACLFTT_02765 [Candidatus Hydrogenedentota bacterium]
MKFPSLNWLKSIESVGWVFFLIVFGVLIYPGLYLARGITYDASGTVMTRVMIGVFGAAIAAAFLTWLFNLVLEQVVLWTQRSGNKKKSKSKNQSKNKGKKKRR